MNALSIGFLMVFACGWEISSKSPNRSPFDLSAKIVLVLLILIGFFNFAYSGKEGFAGNDSTMAGVLRVTFFISFPCCLGVYSMRWWQEYKDKKLP